MSSDVFVTWLVDCVWLFAEENLKISKRSARRSPGQVGIF